jgi:LacI family transcriptional regulator
MRRRHVTIGDIAQQSDASIATVSMVLRDKPGISAATRSRVLEVARELGYQRRASSAPRDRTRNIAMIFRSRSRGHEEVLPTVNAFYSWVMTGIEAAAQPNRMNLLYATLPVDDDNRPMAMPDHLLSQSLEGMLLIGSFAPEVVERIAASRATPIVLVDGPAIPTRHDAIVSDNEGGAYDAVMHLARKGHRRIALVGPDTAQDPNFAQREEGYLRAMRAHDLAPCPIRIDGAGPDAVTAAIGDALMDTPDLSAMFACNDAYAIEVMHALERIDRRVPDDISVIGFDDITPAGQMTPGLTTMAVDKVSMGRLAILMLDYRLSWPKAMPSMTLLRPELRERESVCAFAESPGPRDGEDVLASMDAGFPRELGREGVG